jgi:dTDP-4-dehydrorhamnose 3,5-epimerase
MIDGVQVTPLRVMPDERGRLMEIFRNDDPLFERFGQTYMTTAYPGVVKAWHYHATQSDNMAVVHGMMKIVLYDARDDSPTKGEIMEIVAGIHRPVRVHIPPGVYHGFKCIGEHEAVVVNVPDRVYNYDEPDEYRVDPHSGEVPYDWSRKDG